MTSTAQVPAHLREYFGHDKVALFGSGGMPAAPPAPPGSPARRQGEVARADALAKVGSTEPRPGLRPAALPPRPGLSRLLRRESERALMECSMQALRRRIGAPPPHHESSALVRYLIVPLYRAVPWRIKKRLVALASGVRGWSTARR